MDAKVTLDEQSVLALPIKQANKLGVVLTVQSDVLGARVVIAPKLSEPSGGLVVFTWREAYIMAQARLEPELLRHLYLVKQAFPGAALERVSRKPGAPARVDVDNGCSFS